MRLSFSLVVASLLWPAVLSSGAAAWSCSIPPADARFTPAKLPEASTFPPVAELLSLRCGTSDCHGTSARNLQIYGSTGLRWLPTDKPFFPVCNTTQEDTHTYDSVVGLEPEKMSIVASGGDPSLLTMVNKARGIEDHKGGQIWQTGDDSDLCLTTWLQGKPSAQDCESAVSESVSKEGRTTFLCCFGADPAACQ
jgi:hypothetical protein